MSSHTLASPGPGPGCPVREEDLGSRSFAAAIQVPHLSSECSRARQQTDDTLPLRCILAANCSSSTAQYSGVPAGRSWSRRRTDVDPDSRSSSAASVYTCTTATPIECHRIDITPALRELHWLPVAQRIEYKLCLLVHKTFVGHTPDYISDLLTPVADIPTRSSLRASSNGNLFLPRTERRFGDRAFLVRELKLIFRLNPFSLI